MIPCQNKMLREKPPAAVVRAAASYFFARRERKRLLGDQSTRKVGGASRELADPGPNARDPNARDPVVCAIAYALFPTDCESHPSVGVSRCHTSRTREGNF